MTSFYIVASFATELDTHTVTEERTDTLPRVIYEDNFSLGLEFRMLVGAFLGFLATFRHSFV